MSYNIEDTVFVLRIPGVQEFLIPAIATITGKTLVTEDPIFFYYSIRLHTPLQNYPPIEWIISQEHIFDNLDSTFKREE